MLRTACCIRIRFEPRAEICLLPCRNLAVEKSMDLLNYSETGACRVSGNRFNRCSCYYSALHGCFATERALGDMLSNPTCALSDGICFVPPLQIPSNLQRHLCQYGWFEVILFGVPCATSSGGFFWTTKNYPNKSSANVRAEIGVA